MAAIVPPVIQSSITITESSFQVIAFFPFFFLFKAGSRAEMRFLKRIHTVYMLSQVEFEFLKKWQKKNKINKICYISCCSFVWSTTSDLRISYDNFAFVLVKPSGYWISCEAASISFARSWTSQTSSYLLASYCCSNF